MVALVAFFFLSPHVEAVSANVDSLYRAAMEQMPRVSYEESLKAFQEIEKLDSGYSPVYYGLAKLYLTRDMPVSRNKAILAIRKAIGMDSQNIDFHLLLGDIMWAQGFWANAEKQYEKVYEKFGSAEAAYKVGSHALRNFIRFKDMRGDGAYRFRQSARQERNRAIRYLKLSIDANPVFWDAYYLLGLAYLEGGSAGGLVQVAEKILALEPNNKDALLFGGLGHQRLRRYQDAFAYYYKAFRLMESEERRELESVDLVATEEEKQRLQAEQDAMGDRAELRERARFWRRRDPLLLTDFNERLMDHYGRIAYANLRFSRPSKGVAGWQTQMGKAYLRFGRYLTRMTSRGIHRSRFDVDRQDLGAVDLTGMPSSERFRRNEAALNQRSRPSIEVDPGSETWFYEHFKVDFFLQDGFHEAASASVIDYKRGGIDWDEALRNPRYVDPYLKVKYRIPHQVAVFQDGDSIRVELSYALPEEKLKPAEYPRGVVSLQNGIFVFNRAWREVYRKVEKTFPRLFVGADPKWKTYYRLNHLIVKHTFYVTPGTYDLVVEVQDEGTKAIGEFRDAPDFSIDKGVLQVSDLLLASQIASKNDFPESRADLEIVPNPLRTFRRTDPVYIYLELYHLKRNAFGRTRYEISYRLGAPQKEELDRGLFTAVDLSEIRGELEIAELQDYQRHVRPLMTLFGLGPGDLEESRVEEEADWRDVLQNPEQLIDPERDYQVQYVLPPSRIQKQIEDLAQVKDQTGRSVTATYEGDREDDFTYLNLDIRQMPVGVYKLQVMVRDQNAGEEMGRSLLFLILEE